MFVTKVYYVFNKIQKNFKNCKIIKKFLKRLKVYLYIFLFFGNFYIVFKNFLQKVDMKRDLIFY